MKVKYIGKKDTVALDRNKVYEVIYVEKDWYRIMTELDDDYLFPPEQFEIVGMAHGEMGQAVGISSNYTDDECKKLLHENKAFRRGFVCYRDKDNKLIVPYMRILIRKKAGV